MREPITICEIKPRPLRLVRQAETDRPHHEAVHHAARYLKQREYDRQVSRAMLLALGITCTLLAGCGAVLLAVLRLVAGG